jgi:hypothetical protein
MGEFEFEFELVMCIGSDDVVLEVTESGGGGRKEVTYPTLKSRQGKL